MEQDGAEGRQRHRQENGLPPGILGAGSAIAANTSSKGRPAKEGSGSGPERSARMITSTARLTSTVSAQA